jgi:DNA polymerase III sliding clamp (beta) subunit (PCNA family)
VKDVVIFKKIIDSLSSLVNEVNLEATSNGLSLQAMDSAHVSLVSLNMKEEGFEELLLEPLWDFLLRQPARGKGAERAF